MSVKESKKSEITISVADDSHLRYIDLICQAIDSEAKQKDKGIARRSPAYIRQKMIEGKAVIALTKAGEIAGFCYVEAWGREKNFIANSGLFVVPRFRELGLGKLIKKAAFELSRRKFSQAKIFGLTTSPAVMKINYQLGYRPVTYDQLTDDQAFWDGCRSCTNYHILNSKNYRNCLCTAMLFDPAEKEAEKSDEEKSRISI